MKLFIHAVNVHQGGGSSLLNALLEALPPDLKSVALLDARMEIIPQMPEGMQIIHFQPTIMKRLQAEFRLAGSVREGDSVLCFGNLPPLFKLSGRVSVFVQNKYLLEDTGLNCFSWKTRFRLKVERFWFKWRAFNADQFIVQTRSMKSALESRLCGHTDSRGDKPTIPILILPFLKTLADCRRSITLQMRETSNEYDFLYVASGEPHKNHRRLIEAWCLLAEDGLFPSLCLTLDEIVFADLCAWIEKKKEQLGLRLDNRGLLSHDKVVQLYGRVGALVYPSTIEALGLPLIEARQCGLPVVAAELDYVRDVLDPEQSFNPDSPISIARAIKRFMGVEERPLPLRGAADFLHHILNRVE